MILSINNVELRSALIHNVLMHFQAECFDHAGGLVDEFMKGEHNETAAGNHLRLHARALCPGHQCQSERPVSISSPSPEVEKSDKPPQSECPPGAPPSGFGTGLTPEQVEAAIKNDEGFYGGKCPPPAETVLAEGVVKAGQHVTHNLATGEVKTEPIIGCVLDDQPEPPTAA